MLVRTAAPASGRATDNSDIFRSRGCGEERDGKRGDSGNRCDHAMSAG